LAHNLKLSNLAVNTLAEGASFSDLFDSGYLRIYDGAQPANADTAITTQTLLAELRLSATAFGAVANGVLTANAIVSDSSADATGTAAWARILKSDGTTVILDGSLGVGTFDFTLPTTTIVAGQIVSMSTGVITIPKA